MSQKEQKMIREAGTPALLCFMPEEQPAGCRITSLINMKNQGTLHSNVIYAYSEPSKRFLTVSVAPFTINNMYIPYIKLSLEKKTQGAGKTCIFFHNSYFSQHVLEGKHPSSRCIKLDSYLNLSPKK